MQPASRIAEIICGLFTLLVSSTLLPVKSRPWFNYFESAVILHNLYLN